MTSQILNNSGSIDTSFPVAGQDNDTAGFRSNFSNIKSAFQTAQKEISDLQNYAVLKANLNTPSETVINDLGGSTIDNALFKRFYGTAYISPVIGTSTNVNLNNGHFQVFPISAGLTLNFTNWPESSQFAKVTLFLTSSNGSTHNVSFASTGGTIVKGNAGAGTSGFPTVFQVPYKVEGKAITSASGQPVLKLSNTADIQPGNAVTAVFSIASDTKVESVNAGENTVTLDKNIVTSVVGTTAASGTNENLSGVSVIGTSGQFICRKTTLSVGEKIEVSGTVTNSPQISGAINITSTAGEFTCSTPTELRVGQAITISGTVAPGIGSFTPYTSPQTYYIIDTNGSTIFQLSTTPNGAPITSVVGATTGLTFTKNFISGYTNVTKNYYIIETNGSSTFTLSESVDGDPIVALLGTPAGLTFKTGTVTLSFNSVDDVIPFSVGQLVTVSGVTPTTYNGTYRVTAASTTSVSFKGLGTGAQTIAGFVTALGVATNVPITFTYPGPRVVEAWTYNGGSTVYLSVVGNY